LCSGKRIPVAELRSVKTARAAASISAEVTAPICSAKGDVVEGLADRQRGADDVGRTGKAVMGVDCGRLHALFGPPHFARIDAMLEEEMQLRLDRRFQLGGRDSGLRCGVNRETAQADRTRRIIGAADSAMPLSRTSAR